MRNIWITLLLFPSSLITKYSFTLKESKANIIVSKNEMKIEFDNRILLTSADKDEIKKVFYNQINNQYVGSGFPTFILTPYNVNLFEETVNSPNETIHRRTYNIQITYTITSPSNIVSKLKYFSTNIKETDELIYFSPEQLSKLANLLYSGSYQMCRQLSKSFIHRDIKYYLKKGKFRAL